MDETEKHLRIAILKPTQRSEIGVVAAGDRYGHMHPIDATFGAGDRKIGYSDRETEGFGFDKMPMRQVAVTEMITEHHRRRNHSGNALELSTRPRPRLAG